MFLLRSDMKRPPPTCLQSALLQSDHSPQLCLLRSACSIFALLNSDCSAHAPICLDQIAQICSVFRYSGTSNFSSNNPPLRYTSNSLRMYYNIEVINNLNIEFIVIVINGTQYPNRNVAGILVLNSDPDLHFCPDCDEQPKN